MKDLNELIERKLNHIRSTYIPRCEECLHWKIEWEEYYDNSYCLLKSRGMSCNKEVSPRVIEDKVRASINQDINNAINEVIREYIKENVKDEYRKYLPFRYEGYIK